jgi:hypothetical protein
MKRIWTIKYKVSQANKAAFVLTKEDLISKMNAQCGYPERDKSNCLPSVFFPIDLIHEHSTSYINCFYVKKTDTEEEISILTNGLAKREAHRLYNEEDLLISLALEHFSLIGIEAKIHSKAESCWATIEYRVSGGHLQPCESSGDRELVTS